MVNKTELAIQRAVIGWTKDNCPESIITAIQNEKHHFDKEMLGCKGITDLILFHRKDDIMYVLFLELKTNGKGLTRRGTLLPSQLTFNRVFDTCFASTNAKRALCYGFDEAINTIKGWLNNGNKI